MNRNKSKHIVANLHCLVRFYSDHQCFQCKYKSFNDSVTSAQPTVVTAAYFVKTHKTDRDPVVGLQPAPFVKILSIIHIHRGDAWRNQTSGNSPPSRAVRLLTILKWTQAKMDQSSPFPAPTPPINLSSHLLNPVRPEIQQVRKFCAQTVWWTLKLGFEI